MHRFRILFAIAFAATSAALSHAQTTATLDATSGTATVATNYSTTGNLTLNLGFYADYLIVGGGGGGGNGGGGGGGGGFLGGTAVQMNAASYGVTVGGGGAASAGGVGGTGGNSIFNSGTANGGGGGGGLGTAGTSGGSGGGGGSRSAAAGSATQASPGFGNGGGAGGSGFDGGDLTGGGGGGAGATGGVGSGSTSAGNGGNGRASTITGASVTYAGGGGGGRGNRVASGGSGGSGGGGSGGTGTGGLSAGTNGLGGGGGGGGAIDGTTYNGGQGGSGIVIIRYAGTSVGAIGGTVTTGTGTAAGTTLHTFTTTGNSTFNLGAVNFNARLGATLTGTISGASGSFTYNGPGTLTLAADNTYVGATVISGGTLRVGNGGTTGSLGAGAVTNNSAVVFNRSDSLAVANTIGGSGSVTQQGGGVTTLSGSNSYSGGTTISAGTLALGSAGALGSSGTISFAGGTLRYSSANATDYSARFSSAVSQRYAIDTDGQTVSLASALSSSGGSLTKIGAGTLTLAAANSYTGTTTITSGTLVYQNTYASGFHAIASGATLDLYVASGSRDSATTVFSGSGTLRKTGAGRIFWGSVSNSATFSLGAGSLIAVESGTFTGGSDANENWTTNLSDLSVSTGAVFDGVEANARVNVISGSGTIRTGYSGAGYQSFAIGVNNGSGTFHGVIENSVGAGSVVKTGTGVITLAGNNTYSGGTTINGGVLSVSTIADSGVSNIGTTGPFSLGGGTLRFTGASGATNRGLSFTSGSNAIDVAAGSVLSLGTASGNPATWSGGGGVAKIGAGTLVVHDNGQAVVETNRFVISSNYGGDFTMREGSLTISPTSYLTIGDGSQTAATATYLQTGGTATFTATGGLYIGNWKSGSGNTATLSISGGTFTQQVGVAYVGQGSSTGNTGNLNIGGSSDTASFMGVDIKVASANNTGNINLLANGVLTAAAVSGNGGTSKVTFDGGMLRASGNSTAFMSGLTAAYINAGGATIDAQAFSVTVGQALLSGTSSGGGLTKIGVGNLTLTGTSAYTGATSVAAGRLSVNGALGTTTVAVLAAAELGGSGSIGGPVSIANGGTLAPGNSIASLATGTATFASGGTFEYEVDSTDLGALGTAADLLVVNGDLNLDPGNGTLLTFLDLDPTPQFFPEDTTIFAMINYTGNWNGGLFTLGSKILSDGERFMVGSQQWEIDYNASNGGLNFTGDYLPSSSFVTVTAVPEPSTYAMALAGLACGGYSMWRRRKRA